jgi:UDPglucose 6-dehydrogenase
VLLLTEWAEFADLTPDDLGAVVAQRNMVDGRNVLTQTYGARPDGITGH